MSSRPAGTLAETTSHPGFPRARQAGELVASKYRLERPLAEGGMGSLWVARHVELDVQVAIKFNALERGGVHDLRFRREARATARLKSPHIVQVFDYGIEAGEPYIAMELLEGESVRELLEREGRLPLARVAALIADVAKGLQVAHVAGIVHRDLKPSNLFLARSGQAQVVKILDFGIAKASAETGSETAGGSSNLGGEATRVGTIVGSPAYMSPEQARGELVDERSDLWSLSVVTFRMLTGSEPFGAARAAETLERICSAPVPSACELAPELPSELDDFFERGLARPTQKRFQSAFELGAALAALAARHPAAEPASANTTGTTERAIGRTAETRPIEIEPARAASGSTRTRSRRVAAGALAALVGATLALYFFLNRSPASSEIERKTQASVETREPPPARTPNNPSVLPPVEPSPTPATTSDPGARPTSPRPPPRRSTAQRAPQAEAPPSDSRVGPPSSPPSSRKELDPMFGLAR